MRGPGLRLDLDVRRVWRCAVCGTERHTRGATTLVACHFCQDHPPMSLVEPQRALRSPAGPLDLVIDLHPDDVDAPAFVPAHLRDPEVLPPTEQESTDSAIVTESLEETEPSEIIEAATTESATIETEPSPTEEPRPPKKSSRRKKPRRKRKRRKDAANQSTTQEASQNSTPAGPEIPPSSSSSGDTSFGAGIDS